MALKDAREQVERLLNEFERLINEKEILFNKTQPHAVDTTKENVAGGLRSDKYLNYVETLEEKQINERLKETYERINNYRNWITKELRILGKYNELEQLIVYFKEEVIITDKYTKKSRGLTWAEISEKVHYSPDYCRRIYRNYRKKRDEEERPLKTT